jgi:Protein of unknown function (DUF4232)
MIRTRVVFGGAGIVVAVALGAIQAGAAHGQTARAAHSTAKNAAPATCRAKELGITLTQASPGLTHHGYVVEFKNRGRACTITGYPGVDGLNAKGHRILSAKRTKSGYLGGVASGAIPKVHLAKGKTASAIVEWSDLGSPCPRAHSLRITPPNAVNSVVLSPKSLKSETLCRVEVHPVVPGTTGQAR